MLFRDLYNFAEKTLDERSEQGLRSVIVSINALKKKLIRNVDWLNDINIYPIDCKEGDPLGHFECYGDEESRWDPPESWTVLITYNDDEDILNDCYQRMVWCKEMMHIFDSDPELVHDGQKFSALLNEIELRPLNPSEMYISENRAKWMALLILCPKKYRDLAHQEYQSGKSNAYEVALRFRVPEIAVPSLFSTHYDDAYKSLIEQG